MGPRPRASPPPYSSSSSLPSPHVHRSFTPFRHQLPEQLPRGICQRRLLEVRSAGEADFQVQQRIRLQRLGDLVHRRERYLRQQGPQRVHSLQRRRMIDHWLQCLFNLLLVVHIVRSCDLQHFESMERQDRRDHVAGVISIVDGGVARDGATTKKGAGETSAIVGGGLAANPPNDKRWMVLPRERCLGIGVETTRAASECEEGSVVKEVHGRLELDVRQSVDVAWTTRASAIQRRLQQYARRHERLRRGSGEGG
jgi:hypothetical protein